MMQRVGQQFGHYRLHRLLGQGGFAEVYMGYHRYLQTPAAIKILRQPLSHRATQAFLLEAQTVARLLHPHIVRVLDFGVERDIPFLVMDYAPYGSLHQRYQPGRPVPLEEVVPLVQQVAQALQYAHLAGRIHQDIKPENLLLGWHHQVWLSDFGFAIPVSPTSQVMTLGLGGTLDYAAPEQLNGDPVPASDQYALGVVVYEWLSGQMPFVGHSLDLAIQHILVSPPPLRQYLPTLPSAVEEVVLTALSKDPEQRFLCVADFADALSRASQRAPSSYWSSGVPRKRTLRAPASAGSPHVPRQCSLQDRRFLPSAPHTVSGRRTTSRNTSARTHTPSPFPMLPLHHDQLPSVRKLPLPISPSAPPPRWVARERLAVGLLLLIVLCLGTLSASFGSFQSGAGRATGSSVLANGAAVPPALMTTTPSSSASAGPTTPTPSPSPALPIFHFSMTPGSFVDHCGTHKTTLPSKTLLLDTRGSTVSVTWRVQIITPDQTGHLWATASPASGSIPAGQRATLLLLPASKLCQHTKGAVTYQALLTYQGGSQAGAISITDLVTDP